MVNRFIKKVETSKYVILFNMLTGYEITFGKNGHPDPFILEFPNLLDIGIMGHCKNKCPFCYQGDLEQPNMKLEDFKKIIDEARTSTNQVALGGRGDPNLHENFEEIVEYCRLNNVIPNYTTSGLGLTDNQIEVSKSCGAVAVSDYGKDFTYSAIKRFMDADIKTNIHFLLSSKTLARAINLLTRKDIWNGKVDLNRLNAVIFLLFKPQGRGKDLKGYTLSDNELAWFGNLRSNKLKFKIGMDSCLVNKVKTLVGLTKDEEIFLDTCEAARMSTYVTPDMKLVPCSFADHNKYGISIRDRSIQSVWNSGETFNWCRKILEENNSCCPFEL